jgi:hypothetical protein
MEDQEVSPDGRLAEGCTHDHFSRTSWDDWENLLEISSENHGDTAKWMMVVVQLLQSPVKSLRCMTGEHRSLIPDAQHVLSSENVA